MKTPGGNASSNAALAILTALFEHLMKTGVITPDAKSAILADAIERLKNADNNDMWIRGATEAVEGLRSDLAKIKL
jgi:hypothetical protein